MVTCSNDWKESSIGALFNVFAGGDVKKQYFSKFRTALYKYEIFSNGIDNRGHYGFTSEALFPGNSVTVTARGTIGQAFYREAPYDAIIRLLVLTPKTEDIKPKFYEYFINSQIVFECENTGVPQLTAPKIKEKAVPFLPSKEQEKIIETLQCFDTYIDDLAELIEKKRGIREGVLEDLMSGRTRLKGFVDNWQNEKLLNHVQLIQGLTYTPEDVSISGTLVLRSSNIQNKRLSLEDNVYVRTSVPHEKIICAGDILICVRNGSADLIGKNCILPDLINTTFGAFMSVLRGDTTGFIAKVFDSSIVQEQVRSRTSATINQITKKDFESIMIPWPSEDEQKAIASVLTTMDEEIEALETERDKMIQIREGVMDDLLTGRVRLSV